MQRTVTLALWAFVSSFYVISTAALTLSGIGGGTSVEPIPIVNQEQEINFDGTFHSNYETGNGISIQQQGLVKPGDKPENQIQEIIGSFKYTAPDNQVIEVKYIANELGFQPQGAHLPIAPTPPPIPAAIQRALDWIQAHPPPKVVV